MFKEPATDSVRKAYELARKTYKALGVDTEAALERLGRTAISLHCWQGDDVRGFEVPEPGVSGGGILATGNYPGPARTGDELRADAAKAFSLIPAKLRFNLHAIYAETGGQFVPRDELKPQHFRTWMAWAKATGACLDFNPTFFAHPLANSGYTLSNADEKVRAFWVRHAIACRRIAEAMGKAQGSPCVLNHWLPDGAKDHPVDRWGPRQRLVKSLDEMLAVPISRTYCKDAIEGKLFGIGCEDFTVGSNEFYLAYAVQHPEVLLCMDMGHYHPTETLQDKVSAVLTFKKEILLHVSRGIRWDSDHVVIANDDLRYLFQELVRGDALDRVNIALDYFDASINRVGAWVIGTRAVLKALLAALLEPTAQLRELENRGALADKLALLEEARTLPLGAVWDRYCLERGVPVGPAWIGKMQDYDRKVIRKRA